MGLFRAAEKRHGRNNANENIPIGSRQIDQLAIYKRGGGGELGFTEKNLQLSWSERDDLTRNPIKKIEQI